MIPFTRQDHRDIVLRDPMRSAEFSGLRLAILCRTIALKFFVTLSVPVDIPWKALCLEHTQSKALQAIARGYSGFYQLLNAGCETLGTWVALFRIYFIYIF